jgi:hypothetical protein
VPEIPINHSILDARKDRKVADPRFKALKASGGRCFIGIEAHTFHGPGAEPILNYIIFMQHKTVVRE